MKILKKIIRPTKKYERYTPDYQIFPELDIERISDDLDLQRKGKKNGSKNKPNSDASFFDDTENNIVDYINREVTRSFDIAIQNFNSYFDRIRSLTDSVSFHKIETLKRETVTAINATHSIIEDSDLYNLKKKILNQNEEISKFKIKNRLQREASYPDSNFLSYSIITLLFLLESIANGYFFAKGHELGYLGGVVIAVLISLVNIGFIGILFGWVFSREVVHVNLFRKLFGFLFILITIASSFIFNLLVAHYRSAYVAQSKNPEEDAIYNFVNNPFNLYDIESVIFIFVGVGFCLMVILKMWHGFEKYPGYEKLNRKLEVLQNDYANIKASLITDLRKDLDSGMEAMEIAVKEFDGARSTYPTLKTRIESIKNQYIQYVKSLEQNGNTLLSIYREANRKFRTTEDPAYWGNKFKISQPNFDALNVPDSILTSDFSNQANSEVQDMIKEVYSAYDRANEKVKSLEELEI